MSNELPNGWATPQLEKLFEFVIGGDWGKEPNFEDTDYVEVFCIRGTEFRHWDQEKGISRVPRKIKISSLEKRALKEGDILIEISGGGPDQPVGRTVHIDSKSIAIKPENPSVCTNFIRLARPVSEICSCYLNYYLKTFYLSGEVTKYQGGSNNLRNLKFKEYITIPIPFAPINEQIGIADKLDSLLTKVDAAQKRLDKIPTLLKRFRQSVLAAATSGELTKEWREENNHEDIEQELKEIEISRQKSFEVDATNHQKRTGKKLRPYDFSTLLEQVPERNIPPSWKIVELGTIISVLTDYHANGSYQILKKMVELKEDKDYACMIRATNFEKNNFDDLLIYISKEAYEFLGKSKLFGREILVGKIGNAGFVYHMPILNQPASLAMNLFALRFDEELVNSSYIYMFLKSDTGEENIQKYVRGVATKSIDKKSLRSVFVNLPTINEQKEIVRRVESLFTLADTVEKQYLEAKKRTDRLTQSILAKAFRGELVPQDPNDEPAEELLKRIQAEREAQKPVKKTRKTRSKKGSC